MLLTKTETSKINRALPSKYAHRDLSQSLKVYAHNGVLAVDSDVFLFYRDKSRTMFALNSTITIPKKTFNMLMGRLKKLYEVNKSSSNMGGTTGFGYFLDSGSVTLYKSPSKLDKKISAVLREINIQNEYVMVGDGFLPIKQKYVINESVVGSPIQTLCETITNRFRIGVHSVKAIENEVIDFFTSGIEIHYLNTSGDLMKVHSIVNYGNGIGCVACYVTANEIKMFKEVFYTDMLKRCFIDFKINSTVNKISLSALFKCSRTLVNKFTTPQPKLIKQTTKEGKPVKSPKNDVKAADVSVDSKETFTKSLALYSNIRDNLGSIFFYDTQKESYRKVYGVRLITHDKKSDVIEIILTKTGSDWIKATDNSIVKVNASTL